MNMTIINCSNCNRQLLKGDKDYCEKNNLSECSECRTHRLNGTRKIKDFNKVYLSRNQEIVK